eukprot:330293-Chlamydomonas_euryale.AAC.2
MQTSSSVSPSSCLASPAGPGGHSPGKMSSAGTPAHSAPHRFPNVLPPAQTGSHSNVHMQVSSTASSSSCLASPAGPGGHSPGEMSSAGTPAHSAPHRFPNVLPPAHTGSHSIVHMQVSSSSVSPAAPGTASAPHLPSTMSPFSKPAQLARQRLPKSLPPAQTGSYTSMQLHAASLLGPTGSPARKGSSRGRRKGSHTPAHTCSHVRRQEGVAHTGTGTA